MNETSKTLVSTNSLSEQLKTINLNQANIMAIIQGLQESVVSNKELVSITLSNMDGTTSVYQVPTNSFIYKELQSIIEKDRIFEDILSGNKAFLVDESGNYREVVASSFKQSVGNEISDLTVQSQVRVDYSRLINDLIYPSTNIVIDLNDEHKFVEQASVKTILIKDEANWALFNSRDELQKVYGLIRTNGVAYEENESIYNTDVRRVRYYGDFNVLEVKHNDDASMTLLLSDLRYNDARSISKTRELANNDVLVSADGSTKFQIITMSYSKKEITISRIFGAGSIIPGEKAISYYDNNVDDVRSLSIPVKGAERLLIFISLVNPINSITSAWSAAYKVDTNDLTVLDNETEVSLTSFFNNKVLNIGEYLKQLINEATIPISLGIRPNAPTVKTEFFKVTQINRHVTDNADIQKLNKLNVQKTTVFNEISGITEKIGDVKSRLNAGAYKSTKERDRDNQQLNQLIAEKSAKSELYASLVRDIGSKLTSDQIEDITPKFRIRGFWPIQEPIASQFTRDQNIIKYGVQYRYVAATKETADTTTYTYTDENGKQIIGSFSAWQVLSTEQRRKSQASDGTWIWDSAIVENSDTININQLDIPIRPGESVEIRIKALSEAGYPISYTESEWSQIVRIDFPNELLGTQDLSRSLSQNLADLRQVELNNLLKTEGITDHIKDSFQEQSSYYAHHAKAIASGRYTPEQKSITLDDYLKTLEATITNLQSKVLRQTAEVSVQILDEQVTHTVQRFSTLRLFAGYYTSTVDLTNAESNGAIVEKKFYLKLSNLTPQVIEMLSINPGNLSQIVGNVLYENVPLSIPQNGITSKQYNGQIMYLRNKDLTGVTDLTTDNFVLSNSIIDPADINTGASVSDQNVWFHNGTTFQRVALLSNAAVNDYVAIHANHPVVQSYLSDSSAENVQKFLDETTRAIRYNSVLRENYVQTEFNVDVPVEFLPNDRYLVGKNSCGAKIFLRIPSLQFIQVSGSDNSSFKYVQPGEANAILVPLVFQYRMTDALGRVDGVTDKDANDNFDYVKKLGFDMIVANNLFKFDLEVVSKFRPTTISNADLPINILDQIGKAAQSNAGIVPGLN